MAIETKDSGRHHARIHVCVECAAWSYADRGAKHEKIVHRLSCASTEQPGQPAPSSQDAMVRSAKEGTLRRDYSEDEIVGAVAVGLISVSDAMNQDM